jgi:replication factor A1
MGLSEIVERILSIRHDLTREEVLRMIKDKKTEAGGYFTDESAARLVASELGIEISREPLRPEILIRDLVSGLNDVTVTGRVIIVYPSKTFVRSGGVEGSVARLLIADKSDTLRVALWDDKASLIYDGKVKPGQIIRVLHGYVREGLYGKLELHVGSRGDVQISPLGAADQEYPLITSFIQKIGEITRKTEIVNVLGIVHIVYSVSTFERNDGTHGKVMRLRLRDETGQITAVFWNKKIDELGEVKIGDCLRIMDARVKESSSGQIEIYTKDTTQIEKLLDYEEKITAIANITEEGGPITVEGIAETAPTIREVTTAQGEKVVVASFEIADKTGKIRVSLWRKLVETVKDLLPGTQVKIRNTYVKRGLSNQLELTSRMLTAIEILPKNEE